MLTRKARLLLSLTTATPLLFAACTDNGIFNPLADAAGTYQLTVYAGKTLIAHYDIQPNDPSYPEYPDGATLDVVDGTMVLNSNGTFIETNNYVITPTGGAALDRDFVSQGTWTLSGPNLTLTASNPFRDVTGTLTIDTVNNVDTINYTEADGAGGFPAYEYKR